MTLRTTKLLLVFAVAFFYSLVVLNNTMDYNSNFPVVRLVMMWIRPSRAIAGCGVL